MFQAVWMFLLTLLVLLTLLSLQRNREDITRDSCKAQNMRHDNSLAGIAKLEAATADPRNNAQAQLALGVRAQTELIKRSPAAKIDPEDANAAIAHFTLYQTLYALQEANSGAQTATIINALVPHQDCAKAVARVSLW